MSFGLGIFANNTRNDLHDISETYYGRNSLASSKQLEQLYTDTNDRFPALIDTDAVEDLSWGMDFSRDRGCITYFFGTRPDSDIAFDFVLEKVRELDLVLYDPQGHIAYAGVESNSIK